MLNLNEIKIGKVVEISNEPYLVIRTDHHKMGRGGAVLKTKLKNLISGSVLEKLFKEMIKPMKRKQKLRKLIIYIKMKLKFI